MRKVLEVFKERGGVHLDLATQYYGQVIEKFECDQSIQTAVEVTAGGRYINFIVKLLICLYFTIIFDEILYFYKNKYNV